MLKISIDHTKYNLCSRQIFHMFVAQFFQNFILKDIPTRKGKFIFEIRQGGTAYHIIIWVKFLIRSHDVENIEHKKMLFELYGEHLYIHKDNIKVVSFNKNVQQYIKELEIQFLSLVTEYDIVYEELNCRATLLDNKYTREDADTEDRRTKEMNALMCSLSRNKNYE